MFAHAFSSVFFAHQLFHQLPQKNNGSWISRLKIDSWIQCGFLDSRPVLEFAIGSWTLQNQLFLGGFQPPISWQGGPTAPRDNSLKLCINFVFWY